MKALAGGLRHSYGIARSAAIYYGNPAKRRRARTLYRDFVRPGDLCFDIGAHIGDRTGHFLALGARVIALEPQPQLMRVLRWLHGGDDRVQLHETAVGATAGKASMLVAAANPTVSSLSSEWVELVSRRPDFRGVRWTERPSVAVTTLDALIAEHGMPAFCKIDVEGYEAEVLKGLSRPIAGLSVEYVAATIEIAIEAVALIARLGLYRFNISPGETMRLALAEWCGAEAMIDRLRRFPVDHGSGDVYARLDNATE